MAWIRSDDTRHDDELEARLSDEPDAATDAPPGSRAKVEALARRAAQGLPLWAEGDRADFEGVPCPPKRRPKWSPMADDDDE